MDLSKYPPPATWYLRELKAWDALHKPKKTSTISQQTAVTESTPVSTIAPVANNVNQFGQDSIPISAVPKPVPLMSSVVNPYPNAQDSETISYVPPTNENELTSHVTDTTPLDSSMPFAQPLFSSFVQPLMSTLQPQPLATNLSIAAPVEYVSKSELEMKADSQNENENEKMAAENSVVFVGDVKSSELFERTMSVSSEVAMEIDWKNDSQCELALSQKPMYSIYHMCIVSTHVHSVYTCA